MKMKDEKLLLIGIPAHRFRHTIVSFLSVAEFKPRAILFST
jgi:hypothetical protein